MRRGNSRMKEGVFFLAGTSCDLLADRDWLFTLSSR